MCRALQICAIMASAFTVGLIVPSAIQAQENAAFTYDPAELPDAKPWTSENFKNNPDNFQFAIIGDRGGGPIRRAHTSGPWSNSTGCIPNS